MTKTMQPDWFKLADNATAIEEAVRIELARRDPNDFAAYVFRDPRGRPWDIQPFHREWNALIPPFGKPARILIITPHGTGKTSMIAVARVLWEIGRNPNIRVRILCADDVLAEGIVRELKMHIENNERLHAVFPDLKPAEPWDRTKLTVCRSAILKDPTVQSESVLGGSTGGRCDLMIGDDICTYRNTIAQPRLIDDVIGAFDNVWLNTLEPDGRVVVLNTPWHQEDNTWRLRRNPEWVVWEKPAEDPVTGELLWPSKLTRDFLREKRRVLGPRHYARGYELKPMSQEERTFSDTCIRRDPSLGWGNAHPGRIVVGGFDPATRGQAVLFTAEIEPETGRRIPLHLLRMKDRGAIETARAILEVYLRFRHSLIFVENNSVQQVFADILSLEAQASGIDVPPIRGYFTGKQKLSVDIGLPSLAAAMQVGKWPIPWRCECGQEKCECHPANCECDSCAWIAELSSHPFGPHQDIVMAQWLCELAVREFQRRGGDTGTIEEVEKQSVLSVEF